MSTLKEYFEIELNRPSLVPVVVVFTKFDLVVSKVLSDIAGADSQSHESASATAHRMSEERCRIFLRRNPADVSFEIVSSTLCFHTCYLEQVSYTVVCPQRIQSSAISSATWS